MGENRYPMEAQLHEAISLTKGCYIGQEVVAKATNIGGVANLLIGLKLNGSVVPTQETLVKDGDKQIGVITSAVFSPRLQCAIALAYLKRPFVEVGKKYCIDIGEDEGLVKKSESRIIDNLLKLEKINLVKILTPEPDLFLLPSNTTRDEALKKVKSKGFSRIPIYEGDSDNIIGILYSKDLLNHNSSEIFPILREPYFVLDKKNVFELLRELQIMKLHMAIVIDEYGRLEGIVTLEDIIEEIFGEIEDERDIENNKTNFVNKALYFDGGTRIADFNDAFLFGVLRFGGISNISQEISESYISEDLGVETMGGFVFKQLGRLPKEGEFILKGNIKLTVEEVKENRITIISAERFVHD